MAQKTRQLVIFMLGSLLPLVSVAGPALNLMSSEIKPAFEENTADMPVWISKPELADHLAVLTATPRPEFGGIQAQYLNAIDSAQKLMEKKFRAFQSDLKYIRQVNGSAEALAYTESMIHDLVFNHAIVKDEWTDPVTGQLYLWMVLPTRVDTKLTQRH